MGRRPIIEIDESLCDGCGACVTGCAEGALAIVEGKARLVREQFCDGFGDCVGQCPTGALQIREREAPAFDMEATRSHVLATRGAPALERLGAAHERHVATAHPEPQRLVPLAAAAPHGPSGGCPGSRVRDRLADPDSKPSPTGLEGMPARVLASDLGQWPVQIHLVPPDAPYFRHRELLVLSTCAPVASADVHWRFLRGRSVVVGCPKLDRTEGYAEKLAAILREPSIPKAIVLRMEVPCCGGLSLITQEAARRSGRRDLLVEEVTLGVGGDVLAVRTIHAPALAGAA